MSLQIACSFCARLVDVPDDYLGAGVRCPYCNQVFAVQQAGLQATEPPQTASLPYELVGPFTVKAYTLPRAARYVRGRGPLLLALGGASIALSVLGLTATALAWGAPVLFGPPAFSLGLTAWLMGQRDMELLRRAIMDPYAEPLTRLGWVSGIIGVFLSVCVTLCGLGGLYLLFARSINSANL